MLRRLSYTSGSKSEGSDTNNGAKKVHGELVKLVEKGRWERVRRLIKRGRISKYIDNSGLSPLALLITSFAPVEIVQELLEYDPEATLRTDSFGATPLHFACLNGTTSDIVRLILEHDQGRSARLVDHDHYTVLHHAVEYICLLIEKRMALPSEGSLSVQSEHSMYLDIIQCLCDWAPEMVFHPTKDSGDTPLDIPQIVLARQDSRTIRQCQRIDDVYQILKRTSVSVYIERKKQWECAGYDFTKKVNDGVSIPSLASSNISSQCSGRKDV